MENSFHSNNYCPLLTDTTETAEFIRPKGNLIRRQIIRRQIYTIMSILLHHFKCKWEWENKLPLPMDNYCLINLHNIFLLTAEQMPPRLSFINFIFHYFKSLIPNTTFEAECRVTGSTHI